MDVVLLGDLSRAGVQAIVVDRLLRDPPADLAFGESYAGDVVKLFPESVLSSVIVRDKVAVGTDVLYGEGTYASGFASTRIYGLVGEGLMNFGFVGGVAVFAALGFAVRGAAMLYQAAQRGSMPASVLAPAVGVTCILMLGSDLDNLIWFTFKQLLPLLLIVWGARIVMDQSRE
jgi:hypothetical protein